MTPPIKAHQYMLIFAVVFVFCHHNFIIDMIQIHHPFKPLARDSCNQTYISCSCGSLKSKRPLLLDWHETPAAHIFKLNVPGYEKMDIKVQVEDEEILVIRGRDIPTEIIKLPENVKIDRIKSQLDNGVLTVVVPKGATSNVRNIRIRTN